MLTTGMLHPLKAALVFQRAAFGSEVVCMKDTSNGGYVQLALLRTTRWRDEIEQAVDRIKESANCSASDRWFRKLWYIAEARRKKGYQVRGNRARRRQIGVHGGGENGREARRYGRPSGASHRPEWADAVLRGPAAVAVQEREESPRILGFRKRKGQGDVQAKRHCDVPEFGMAAILSTAIDRKELRCMNCLALIVPRVRL